MRNVPGATERALQGVKVNREALREAVRLTVAMLCQRWPQSFDLKNRRPLKIGIVHDLVRELGDAVLRPELKGALNAYCGHTGYLSGLRAGTPRLDLDGNAVGIVSDEDELRAAARLRAAKTAKVKAKAKATQEEPLAAPAPTPKRGDGLEGLRAAARARASKSMTFDRRR
jgi:ProP effector